MVAHVEKTFILSSGAYNPTTEMLHLRHRHFKRTYYNQCVVLHCIYNNLNTNTVLRKVFYDQFVGVVQHMRPKCN